MNATKTQCPPESALSDFGLGKLDETAAETISQHLETCADCRQRVASLPGDSFVNRLRGVPDGAAAPGRIEHTFVAGDSASNAAHSSETPLEDGLPRPSRTVDDKAKRGGLGSPSSAPPELASHPYYELIKELGQGGMGVVYLAKNRLMDRLEVLKVVSKSLLDKPGALERFQQEIRSAAKLLHPNIVAAHAVLRPGDLLVFAMEYVPGQDLMQVVKKRGYLPIANATFYAHQVALGLQHAHEKGMVHRDIKPNNLMLAIEGKKHVIKILDFGLAKATSEKAAQTSLTKSGQMLGTPDYIAPEQTLDAQKADIRADIYSLGCTLYYFLAGRPPFQEASLYALLEAHHRHDPTMLNLVRPDVPVELAAVVATMLAKDPAKRYQTPIEVARALATFFKPRQAAAAATLPPRADMGHSELAAVIMHTAASPTEELIAVQGVAAIPFPAPAPTTPASPAPIPLAQAAPAVRISVDTHRNAARRRGWWRSRPPWQQYAMTGGAAALLLLGIVLLVQTPHGTVEIALSDPNADVTVTVDKNRIDIGHLDEPLSLEVGKHDLKVTGNGYETFTKKFTVTRGKNAPLTVTLIPDNTDHEREVARWVLSCGGKVRIEGKDADIIEISQLPAGAIHLASVDLVQTPVADGDLAYLQKLPDIISLSLDDTAIGDDGLANIKELPKLSRLSLSRTKVSSAGMQYLTQFKQLKELHLYYAIEVGDEGLKQLEGLALESLTLWGTSMTGQGLRYLRRMPLKDLLLYDLPIKDDDLLTLIEMPSLKIVALKGTRVTDAGLEHLKRLTGLTELHLQDTKTTPQAIASLQVALPNCKIHTTLAGAAPPTTAASTFNAPADAAAGAVPTPAVRTAGAVLGWTPLEHNNQASCCQFSPDGKLLATGGRDGMVKIWNAVTGEKLHELAVRETVQDVTFSPDSKIVLTWTGGSPRGNSAKWKPKFWDGATAKELTSFPISRPIVGPLVFSPDGTKIAVAGADQTVDLFDAAGKPLGSLLGQRGAITCLAFSPDSKLLASGSDARVMKMWKIADKSEVLSLEDDQKSNFMPMVHTVLFSRDGRLLVVGVNANTLVYDLTASTTLWKKRTNTWRAFSLAVSPDNKFVVAAGGQGDADHFVVADALTDERIRAVRAWRGYREGYRGAEALALSPDGRALATAGPDHTIKIWDTTTWEERQAADVKPSPTTPTLFVKYNHRGWNISGVAALSPDGTKLLASEEGVVRLWDAVTGKALNAVAPEGDHNYITFLPDGKHAAVGDLFGQVAIWEIASGKIARRFQDSTEVVRCISASDDGRLVLACYSGHCEKNPDGSQGWIGSASKPIVMLWNTEGQIEAHRLDAQGADVRSAAFLPHTHHVVWGSEKGVLAVWDADAGKQVREIERELPPVHHLSVSPDGRWVAAALGDWTVGVWDVATQKRVQSIGIGPKEPHDPTMCFVFLSPDGSRVLSLAEDDGARLWDVSTGAEIANTNNKARYYHAAFFPDGRSAILAPPSGDIFKWQLPPLTTAKSAASNPNAGGHERDVAEWVLSKQGNVKLDGMEGQIADVAKLPAGRLSLSDINLRGILLKKEEVARLHDLPNLATLNLEGTVVDDESLRGLARLPRLRTLNLNDTSLTAAGIDSLGAFPKLEAITVSSGDDTVARLSTLPKLSTICVYGTSMTNAGLKYAKDFKNLSYFGVCSRRIDDDGLANLSSDSLECLVLWESSVQGKGLRHLKNLPKLNTLWLHGPSLSS